MPVVARLVVLAALLGVIFASPAHAGGPDLRIGAAEDAVKQPTLGAARAQMDLLKLVGLDTVRITATWAPGLAEPAETEALGISNAVNAANMLGVDVIVEVYNSSSAATPVTDEDRDQFAAFAADVARKHRSIRDVIVGNEPNLNRFWMPQYDDAGESVAPADYLALLARTYDALKEVSPDITVWGGSLSPRGTDNAFGQRPTHSPTTFIEAFGEAYRASGRTLPVMDGLAIHPYGDNSSQGPGSSAHPLNTTVGLADYSKLVGMLTQAFTGTAQPGSALPILYDEYGVETILPVDKAPLYAGIEPATTRPVDPVTQAIYYRQAIQLAFCQPNVRGLMLFHTVDEPDLNRWQSGLFYADSTPKGSLPSVRKAVGESRRGVVATCPGLALTPRLVSAVWPKSGSPRKAVQVSLKCSLDCAGTLAAVDVTTARRVAVVRLRQAGGAVRRTSIGPLAPGSYRLHLSLRAPVNPGGTLVRRSPPFIIR
jgi:hypothetical protein